MAKQGCGHDSATPGATWPPLPCVTDWYAGLPILPLRDVLARIPLPPSCPLSGVSSKWRCVIVPRVSVTDDDARKTARASHPSSASPLPSVSVAGSNNSRARSDSAAVSSSRTRRAERDALAYVQSGLPVMLDESYAAAVHTRAARDGIDFVTDPRWNCFPRPQIALRTGWGAPGTRHETSHYHKLVRSFREVFEHTAGVPVPVTDAEVRLYAQQSNAQPPDTTHAQHDSTNKEKDLPSRPREEEPPRSSSEEEEVHRQTHSAAAPSTRCTTHVTHAHASRSAQEDGGTDAGGNRTLVDDDDVNAVVDAGAEILELQYFHRDGDAASCAATSQPDDDTEENGAGPASRVTHSLPALGSFMRWPSFLDERVGGMVTEVATCVAQRGALRHWHLNDSGEFVLQTALASSESVAGAPSSCLRGSDPGLTAYERCMDHQLFGPHGWARQEEEEDVCEADGLCPHKRRGCHATRGDDATQNEEDDDDSNHTNSGSGRGEKQPRPCRSAQPMRLYLFGARGSYDWFVHDDEATLTGLVVGLDIFHTPDEALPDEASVLPVLAVAVLMSGGPPLLSPPNLPQMSVQLHDGVTVEQRRLSNLWLDEVSYFLHRCAHWSSDAMLYTYLERELQDEHYVASLLIPQLIQLFAALGSDGGGAACVERGRFHRDVLAGLRHRVVCSLVTIAYHEKHYALLASSRASLLQLVRGGHEEMTRVAQGLSSGALLPCAFASPPPYRVSDWAALGADAACVSPGQPDATQTRNASEGDEGACGGDACGGTQAVALVGAACTPTEAMLRSCWDIRRCWPRAGCVLYTVYPRSNASGAPRRDEDGRYADCFVPVVYVKSCPVFGRAAPTLDATVEEYHSMRLLSEAGKTRELHAFLRSRKAHADDVLDELF